jgi:p-cumate 2,3-dioxygenase subunit alpha
MGNIAFENLIVDSPADRLFRVNRRVFTDPSILEAERLGVFDRSWIYAGHESEIPQPGDFRARDVAGRPVILARGSDGKVRVLLNTCTHRGTLVCREAAGNTKTFQCPYHAWTFNNQGDLIGIPREEAYSGAFDRRDLALATAPRMESYRGFIFISFHPQADDLVDYLAGARAYLDLVCDQSEVGMEIVSGTQSYCMRANWKLLVENSIDGYHAPITHQRYIDFLYETGVDKGLLQNRGRGRGLALGNGHSVIVNEPLGGRPIAHWTPMFGEAKKAELAGIEQKLTERLGAERAHQIAHTSRNLFIFPNLIINDIMAITIRTFFPLTPDYMDITAWALAWGDENHPKRPIQIDPISVPIL